MWGGCKGDGVHPKPRQLRHGCWVGAVDYLTRPTVPHATLPPATSLNALCPSLLRCVCGTKRIIMRFAWKSRFFLLQENVLYTDKAH